MANESTVKRGRLPRGYSLVPKGNVYITGNCRKQTQAAAQTVYLVVNTKEKQIGIAVPTHIYEDVKQKEAETRATRAANVDRRDNTIKNEFEKVILREFPCLPQDNLPKILQMALQKRAGKVGRTGQLSDRQKAQLAVRAHIRHCHTQYDRILRGADRKDGKAKDLARKAVQSQVDQLAASWAQGRSSQPAKLANGTAMASSSASALPARSKGIDKSKSVRTAVRAKLATMKQASTAITTAPTINPSLKPQIRKQPPHEVVDLTIDDDDDDEDYEESAEPMGAVMNRYPRRSPRFGSYFAETIG